MTTNEASLTEAIRFGYEIVPEAFNVGNRLAVGELRNWIATTFPHLSDKVNSPVFGSTLAKQRQRVQKARQMAEAVDAATLRAEEALATLHQNEHSLNVTLFAASIAPPVELSDEQSGELFGHEGRFSVRGVLHLFVRLDDGKEAGIFVNVSREGMRALAKAVRLSETRGVDVDIESP